MRVVDVMTKKVRTVQADEPVSAAVELMRRYRVRHLVVQRGSEIVGILSKTDVANLEGKPLQGLAVGDRMTGPAVCVEPTKTLRATANLMRGRSIGCLPVVDGDGRCVGIVTTSDLLECIGRGVERPVEKRERRVIDRRGPRPLRTQKSK